jgi:phospholipase C
VACPYLADKTDRATSKAALASLLPQCTCIDKPKVFRTIIFLAIVIVLLSATVAVQMNNSVDSSTATTTNAGGVNETEDGSGFSTSPLATTITEQNYTYTSTYGESAAPSNNPIQHIIVIMQENRAFDTYFGTYPGAIGIPAGLCIPQDPNDTALGCLKPYLTNDPVDNSDLPHGLGSYATQYDNGRMDGFILSASGSKSYDASESMSYYNGQTLPVLWSFAEHYTLEDMFFGSVRSYSQPNHWYMLAGTAPQVSLSEMASQEKASCVNPNTHRITLQSCTYVNEAQTIQTIVDLLANSGLTWKYYDSPLSATLDKAILDGDALDYWNPLEAQNISYLAFQNNFLWRGQILGDITDGNLPQVSWVIPAASISDHPPANVTLGEYWIGDVVDAVMNSPYWKSTAIIVTFDESGGFFDTIPPPVGPPFTLGFRVPGVIISPYARPGYIDNTAMDFASTLRFIEWRFDLPTLGTQDYTSNNMLSAFNFSQAPLPPYPYALTAQDLAPVNLCLFSDNNCQVNIKIVGGVAQVEPISYSPTSTSDAFIDDDPD